MLQRIKSMVSTDHYSFDGDRRIDSSMRTRWLKQHLAARTCCCIALILVLAAPTVWAQDAATAAPESAGSNPTTESPNDLPQQLADLKVLAKDEKALINAVRSYDRAQMALAEWDAKLAVEYARRGEPDLANAKEKQEQERYELVKAAYEFVLDNYSKNPRALTYYGEVLYDHFGEQERAVGFWKTASTLDETLTAPLNNLALHYCHVGEYDLGLRNLERILEMEPNNPDYLFNVAQIYLTNSIAVLERYKWNKEKLYREAMKFSKQATELDPENFELLQDYATNFFAAENFEVKADWSDASNAWKKARKQARAQDETFFTWLNEGRTSIRAHDKKRAEACLKEALVVWPESTVARRLLNNLDDEIAKSKQRKS